MPNRKHLLLILFVYIAIPLVIADDLVDQYMSKANSHFLVKEYERAYSSIRFVLKFYSEGELPEEAQSLAEKISYQYLLQLKDSSEYELIDEIKLDLLDYPEVSSPRIATLIEDAKTQRQEETKLAQEAAAREEAARIAEAKRIEDARIAEEERKRQDAIRAEERRLAEEKAKREEAIRLEELRAAQEKQAREDALRAAQLQAEKEQKAREDELARQALLLEQEKLKLEKDRQAELLRLDEAKRKIDEEIRLANLKLEEEKLKREEANRIEDLGREEEKQKREEALALEAMKLEAARIEKEAESKAQEIKERMAIESESRDNLNTIIASTLAASEQNNQANTRFSILIIAFIAFIGVLVLAGFGLLIFLFIKRSQQQQSEFESAMVSVRTAPQASHFLPMSTDFDGMGETLALEDRSNIRQLPSPQSVDMEKIEAILPKCQSYAKDIDAVTRRKNGCRNVAELIFRISESSGYSRPECMLYFAVGLIYDIGFLAIDPAILAKQKISEEEFRLVQDHTKHGLNMIHFIDEDLQPVFRDGILKHHENLDGSGYPSGLSSDEIPYIARLLRIADSYVSLISNRIYRQIMDKEAATNELHNKSGEYDPDILDILDNLI